MTNRPAAPLFATINVTTACNLSCPYCYCSPFPKRQMAYEDFVAVVDALTDLHVFYAMVSGGEPFLNPSIESMIRYASEKIDHLMVLTNGTRLSPRRIRMLGEVANGGASVSVQVSLDSCDPGVNEQTRRHTQSVLDCIHALSRAKISVVLSTVVTRHNVSSIVDMVRTLRGVVRHFHVMTVEDVQGRPGVRESLSADQKELGKLWTALRKMRREWKLAMDIPADGCTARGSAHGAPCSAAFTHIVIDPWLDVRPCDRLTNVSLGNLRTASMHDIWNGTAAKEVLGSPLPLCTLAAHYECPDREETLLPG